MLRNNVEKITELSDQLDAEFKLLIKNLLKNLNLTTFKKACIKALNAQCNFNSDTEFAESLKQTKSPNKNTQRKDMLEMIFEQLQNKQITFLDALYDCFYRIDGSYGPHSFKCKLLDNLCEFPEASQKRERAGDYIVRFMTAVHELRKEEEKEIIAKIIARIEKMTLDELKAAYDVAVKYADFLHEKWEQKQNTVVAAVHSAYTSGKGLLRNAASKLAINSQNPFDAIMHILKHNVGHQSHHSTKFFLLLFINDVQWLPIEEQSDLLLYPETTEARFLHKLFVRDEAMHSKGEREASNFVSELIKSMQEEKITSLVVECRGKNDVLGCKQAIEKAFSGNKGMFQGFLFPPAGHSSVISRILSELDVNKITAFDALYACLTSSESSDDKYDLLYQLYGWPLSANDAVEKIEVVQRFTNEMEAKKGLVVPLSSVDEEKFFDAAGSSDDGGAPALGNFRRASD